LAKINLRNADVPHHVHLGSLLRGTDTLCGILRILAASVLNKPEMTVTAAKGFVSSLLDQHRRFYRLLTAILDCSPKADQHFSNLIQHFFKGLRDLVLHASYPRWKNSVQQRLHSLWAECVVKMVHMSQESSFKAIADDIVSVLDTTTEISSRLPGLRLAVCEALKPTVNAVVGDEILHSVVYAKIQV
jgi:hypothetical protein